VLAKTRIAAPPSRVLQTIRNTTAWAEWNSFCPRCTLAAAIRKDTKNSDSKSKPGIASGQVAGEEAFWSGKAGWLDLGSVAVVEVFMHGDGLVPGRKRTREQGVVVTRLEALDGEEAADGGRERRSGYRIAWKSTGWAHWQLHSERVMEFIEVEAETEGEGDGEGEGANGKAGVETEYVCWETFGGVLGPVVKATVGTQLVERFADYARDVRGFVEGRGKGIGEHRVQDVGLRA
jgi:hypothetical protein